MGSRARTKLDENSRDVERLLQLHAEKAGPAPGRKFGLEVLNKSGVVLVCAFWEAYVEDVVAESLEHLIKNVADTSKIPLGLRKLIARRVKEDTNELAPWDLANDGWKDILQDNRERWNKQLTGAWNSPKSDKVSELFEKALGLEKITEHWKRTNLTPEKARKKLDEYVLVRGAIAHRGHSGDSVTKDWVTGFMDHVRRLAEFTDDAVNNHLKNVTGKLLF